MRRVTIIIPYVMGPENGLELRYTLRSIEKNFAHDNYDILVIGSKPDWLKNVNYIHFSRIPDGHYRAFKDQILKLYAAITECDVSNDFIWTYDDVYFTSKVTLSDIKSLKAARRIVSLTDVDNYPGGTNWKNCIKQALDDTGGKFVYETHLPRWFNKKKMLALYDRFCLLGRPTVIASLYYNYFFADQEPILLNYNKDHIRFMLRSTFSPDRLEKLIRKAKFTNNSPATLNAIFKEVLQRLFPVSSKYEA